MNGRDIGAAPAAAGVPDARNHTVETARELAEKAVKAVKLIGPLAELPDHVQGVVKSYAGLVARSALLHDGWQTAAQPQAEQQPLPPCACHDHADAVCAEHSPRAEKAEQHGVADFDTWHDAKWPEPERYKDRVPWRSQKKNRRQVWEAAIAARQPVDELALKQKVIDHMQQRIDEQDAELRAARQPVDDPEFDGTEAAHPAWWRGQERGVEAACERIEAAIAGADDGAGVLGNSRMETLRRKLIAARQPVGEPVGTVHNGNLVWLPYAHAPDGSWLYTAPPAAVDLQGWSIHEDMHGPGIAVCAPNAAPGAMVVENKGPLAQRLLYALASALTDSKAVRNG